MKDCGPIAAFAQERTYVNRLSGEKSPYLLQHAENPVDWYPWGPEALNRALEEDKPILVSIGYSACHWCHVMEREAFEDADIATFMNLHFVNIKVDREERPDVDAIYMEAVQALTGQGGWPLNAFLTSDARPFYGGTYFPPHPAHGLPSWRQVLESVAVTYRDRTHDVMHNAASLTDYVRSSQLLQDDSADVHVDLLCGALDSIQYQFDWNNGGFGGAPKFPQPLALELSLRLWKRFGADEILKFVCLSLDRMLAGGIFDQLGGGFHRYSVDAMWVVPHFEKMLYDNALLARAYLHGFQITGNADYRDVCERTLCYMIRELCAPEGAFYSSQDADSEGIEGRFYVWSPADLRRVLTQDEHQVTSLHFGISEDGNFEGATILTRSLTPADVAERLRKSEEEVRRLLETSCDKLLAARSQRVPPATDTKILASWNALAITTLAEAGRILQRSDFVTSARLAADFVLQRMWTDRRLVRSYRGGPSSVHAFLEDYANLIDALLSLYEACSDARYLDAAGALAVVTVEHFWDEEKAIFFDASADSLDVVVRPRSLFDNPLPSGTASTVMALSRLGALTGDTRYERFVRATFESVAGLVQRAPVGFPALLSALDFHLSAQTQIAVAGDRDEDGTTRLINVVNSTYLPNAVLSVGPEDSSPLLKGRRRQEGAPTAFVCRRMACRLPTRDPVMLQALIEEAAGV